MTGHSIMVRKIPDIRQSEAAECGLACVTMIAAYYGQRTDLASLRRRYPVSLKGMTQVRFAQTCRSCGGR